MINAPTHCPCCDSTLEWSNDQLFCRNKDCLSSTSKRLQHFASTMRIKGLGPSTIDKLEISSLLELYKLSEADITKLIGSEKLASKLYLELEDSKNRSLNVVLPSFGIPLIGKTATDKLSLVCSSIFEIDRDICKAAGLGEKSTNNLINWLDTNTEYLDLPFSYEFEKTSSKPTFGVICITGKLTSYSTKQEAQVELEKLGFIVKSSITKDVTMLVNESGKETSKTQKARDSGIKIITNLKDFIGEFN